MNFFFFLDHTDSNLVSSVNIFNKPPSITWANYKLEDCHLVAFFSDGSKWNFEKIGVLKEGNSIKISKKV